MRARTTLHGERRDQPSVLTSAQVAAPGVTSQAQTITPGTPDIAADAQTPDPAAITVDAITPGADVDVAIDVTTWAEAIVAPPDGLAVLARSSWPDGEDAVPPAIAGFITSSFSPLAAALAELCLRGYFGSRPADAERAEQTAIVLASSTGDVVTATAIAGAVDAGRRVPPLLFFQANPNAVVGYIAARWGLSGPVVCVNPTSDTLADAMSAAALLIEDGDASAALIIVADAGHDTAPRGTAMLVGPVSWPAARSAPNPAVASAVRPPPAAAALAGMPDL